MTQWSRYTSGDFHLVEVPGNHLWPINNPTAKAVWLGKVVTALQQQGLKQEYLQREA